VKSSAKKTKACDKMARSDMSNDLGKGTQQIYFGKMFATKVINKSTKNVYSAPVGYSAKKV
jgi:hypothetical protein